MAIQLPPSRTSDDSLDPLQYRYTRRYVEFLVEHVEEIRNRRRLPDDLTYEFKMLGPYELCRCSGRRKLDFERSKPFGARRQHEYESMPPIMAELADITRAISRLPRNWISRTRLELQMEGKTRAEVDRMESTGGLRIEHVRRYRRRLKEQRDIRDDIENGNVYIRLMRLLNGVDDGTWACAS